jgi:DNA replicative helicase MCM subunit Mcm2 (Cdc46/Mcm family)
VYVYGDMVNMANPGDKIEVTGIYKAQVWKKPSVLISSG